MSQHFNGNGITGAFYEKKLLSHSEFKIIKK